MSREPMSADERERAAEARRAAAREQMRAGIESLRSSEGWRRWAEVRSRFHTYSFGNTIQILAQQPDATLVAGYRRWQELGRQVRQGERAIRVWAPSTRMIENEATGERERTVVAWITVPVFDLAQTDGPPLPEPPAPAELSGDSHAHHWDPLVAAARETGVGVSLGDAGAADGYYRPATREIVVDEALAPNARVATLLHELAHAEGADPARFGRAGAEVVAETAAYVACRAIGLEADPNSIPYVAAWSDAELSALERYAGAVDTLAGRLEKALGLTRGRPERPDPGRDGPEAANGARPAPSPRERAPTGEGVLYVGERGADGAARIDVVRAGEREPLPHRVRHSPTGFEWGYGGSGPADAARSILAHALRSPDPPPGLYQAFKAEHLARAPARGFEISQAEVLAWAARHLDRAREVPERAGR